MSEAARTSLIAEFVLSMRSPKRSRKYQAIHISAATTMPTPTSAIQGSDCCSRSSDSSRVRSLGSMIPWEMTRSIRGRGPIPMSAVKESHVK